MQVRRRNANWSGLAQLRVEIFSSPAHRSYQLGRGGGAGHLVPGAADDAGERLLMAVTAVTLRENKLVTNQSSASNGFEMLLPCYRKQMS